VGKFKQCVARPWKAVDKWWNEPVRDGKKDHLMRSPGVDEHEFLAMWDGSAVIGELEKMQAERREEDEKGGIVKRLGSRLSRRQ
jgi:hypothetical protein